MCTTPPLLARLMSRGLWPSTSEAQSRQNIEPLVAPEVVGRFAAGEAQLFLYREPFLSVAAHLSNGDTFWTSQCAAPADLDHKLAIPIGDFGLGSDSPIVLDYRQGSPAPRVMRLRWHPYDLAEGEE